MPSYYCATHLICFLFVVSLSLSPLQTSCRAASADPVSLTDKTFDNVREAFNYPSMLILSHSNKDDEGDNNQLFFARSSDQKVLEEFRSLSNDHLLQDIMLVTVDVTNNRMLALRMGVQMNELPSLVYLYSDRIFRYQGKPTSANLMRSYALQGFHNQGMGEPMLNASHWLLMKTKYLDWLFSGDESAVDINVTALVFSGFVAGLFVCGIGAIVVLICFKEEEDTKNNNRKKTKRKKQ